MHDVDGIVLFFFCLSLFSLPNMIPDTRKGTNEFCDGRSFNWAATQKCQTCGSLSEASSSVCQQQRVWRDCTDAKPHLSLCWLPIDMYPFHNGWLICLYWEHEIQNKEVFKDSLHYMKHNFNIFIKKALLIKHIWAASWQNQQNDCAPSEDSDQTGRMPRPIWFFAVHMKKAWTLSYPLSAQRRLITGQMPRLIWIFAGPTHILLVLSRHGSF